MKSSPTHLHHPRAAFRHREFCYFIASRFLALMAYQMLVVAVSQAIYEKTHNPLHLGYIGLCLFLPKIAFTLPSGHAADRYDRRSILLASRLIHSVALVGLIVSFGWFLTSPSLLPAIYTFLLVMGTSSTLGAPASQAIVTQLVPPEDFSNAVTWNSSSFEITLVLGPVLGGYLYSLYNSAYFVLCIVGIVWLVSSSLLFLLHPRTDHIEKTKLSWATAMAGLHYVFKKRIILGTISLDLFAVLFGGAVALLPVYANDILKAGPLGLGILRASPAVGALMTALMIAHRGTPKKAGVAMLWCVAAFGLFTIFFGLSKSMLLSVICLIVLGAADMVSVVIRGILVQVKTPPAMRGRVSAVNLIFIGASNELGEFESGLMASWLGIVPSVVLGGLGTLCVVALWSWKFPEIRAFQNLAGPDADIEELPHAVEVMEAKES